MKIGIDARNLVPRLTGIGRYVAEMTRALAAAGHQPVLYLPEAPAEGTTDGLEGYLRIAGFHGAAARMIWAQTALPSAAARDKVDIFWGPAHRLPFRLPISMARVVTIHDLVWVHASETMRWQTWAGERAFVGASVRRADEIVVVSNATGQALRDRYPHLGTPVTTIHHGYTRLVPGDVAGVRKRLDVDRPYILFVGTLEPRKNLVRLLQAWAAVGSALRSGFLLVIAGGQGWRLGDLQSQIEHLGISGDVRLTGYISDSDLASLYAGAYVLAMPSLYEGFGLPIIEANGLGVPVLTSSVASMPEVAGDCAWFVDPSSTSDMVEKLRVLIGDREDRDKRAACAKANAARFDWHRSAEGILQVFERALAARKGR